MHTWGKPIGLGMLVICDKRCSGNFTIPENGRNPFRVYLKHFPNDKNRLEYIVNHKNLNISPIFFYSLDTLKNRYFIFILISEANMGMSKVLGKLISTMFVIGARNLGSMNYGLESNPLYQSHNAIRYQY